MRYIRRYGWSNLIPLLAALLLAASIATAAEEADKLQVRIDDHVIYCAVRLHNSDDAIMHALKDGIAVTTVWRVQVDKVRDYWVDKGIAEITVVRRVVPDLLSRSWLLEDQASGISRRVHMASEANRFLGTLEQFPVLDRTILETDTPYIMSASVELYVGEVNEAWWANLLKSAEVTLQQEFSLP